MRQSLRTRVFLTVFLTISIIYAVSTSLILLEARTVFTKNLTNETLKLVKSSGELLNKLFSEDVEILHTVENSLSALVKETKSDVLLESQDEIIKNIIEDTKQFKSIAINWEIGSIDSLYKKNYGRYRSLYYWQDGKIIINRDTFEIDGNNISSQYYLFKISKQSGITDIYYDSYSGKNEDAELMASIAVPILLENKFVGLVVGDIALERLNSIVSKVKPIPEAQSFIISENGHIVANSLLKDIDKPLSTILGNDVASKKILFKLSQKQNISYIRKGSDGQELVIIEPFSVGRISSNWAIGTIVPMSVIKKDARKISNIGYLFAFLGLILLIISTVFIINSVVRSINKAMHSLDNLSRMEIDSNLKLKILRKDEIGQMIISINSLVDALIEIKDFSYEISKGNLNAKLEQKSDKDVLGHALLQMQKSLRIAKMEATKREQEENLQKWAIDGEAHISSILRQHAQDLDQLTYNIVSYLVKYTKASQGALFIVNEFEETAVLQAAYAYDKRKYLDKTIPFGVGLIGRSIQESEMIYINDIPEGYTSIVSGLGENDPRTLLIVPFKFNESIFAVIELASFYDFKPYVRKFIERVGVSIASTIANLRITVRSNQLVNDLQKRSYELTEHEDAMRQNLEEMQVTQDEMMRKAQEYENIVSALNQVSYVIEYDMDRKIIKINDKFLKLLGKSRSEMLNISQGAFMLEEDRELQLDELWKNLKLGQVSMFTQQVAIGSKILWFSEAYIPVFDESGTPYKVINIANDMTNFMDERA